MGRTITKAAPNGKYPAILGQNRYFPPMGSKLWAALAPEEYKEDFLRELAWRKLDPVPMGNFFLFEGEAEPLAWASVVWKKVERIPIQSISDGAKKLRPLARKWALYSIGHHRRGSLLLDQLRGYRLKPQPFPPAPAESGIGVFALEAPETLLYSLDFDRPDPEGRFPFLEDKSAPSRAYLKLWEALSIYGKLPATGETCMDLGASPGGWSWVLAKTGAKVLSVDRSPLETFFSNVEFRQGDAFQQTPDKIGSVDWLVSDVICYPEKLLEFVRLWVDAGKARHMICTIKFQGKPDPAVIGEFQKIGRVLHLFHNKHELTWMR